MAEMEDKKKNLSTTDTLLASIKGKLDALKKEDQIEKFMEQIKKLEESKKERQMKQMQDNLEAQMFNSSIFQEPEQPMMQDPQMGQIMPQNITYQ